MRSKTVRAPLASRKIGVIAVIGLIFIATLIRIIHDRAISKMPPTLAAVQQTAYNNPNDLQAQLNLGAALREVGRLQEAETVFSAASRLDPRDSRAVVWLGVIAVQQRRQADAIVAFKQALSRDPKDGDVWLALADLQQASGALRDAEDSFETATHLQPANERAWRLLGELDIRRKLLARGQEALQTAVRLDPQDLKAQAALGGLDLRIGRLQEAKAALEVAAGQKPPDAVVLAQLAQADMRLDPSPASLQSAMDLINRSVSTKPTADGRLARGQVHLLRKEYSAAIEDLNAAIKLDRQTLVAYGYLSQAYAAIGESNKSKLASEQYTLLYRKSNAPSGAAAH